MPMSIIRQYVCKYNKHINNLNIFKMSENIFLDFN